MKNKIGFYPANILVPKDIDLKKWSVVACDQYTSQPEYWNEVERFVGDCPSALKISFPEIYLEQGDGDKRIANINSNMKDYVEKDLFCEYKDRLVYIERTQRDGKVRRGIIGAVDLECYDYAVPNDALIRATEGTVLERIPPRVKIRQDAPLEMPHIMLLIDDADKNIIEGIDKNSIDKIYDFDLMQDSGHICGYLVKDTQKIENGLLNLMQKQNSSAPLLFAVGDGNHSLATAKACWENIKAQGVEDIENHPARYALVEVVNIHDTSLEFEPIHRVIFDCDKDDIVAKFKEYAGADETSSADAQKIVFVIDGKELVLYAHAPKSKLEVGTVQKFLDEYVKTHSCKIDYIHGEDVVFDLSKGNNVGIILPPMQKSDLFPAIMADGVLPRKTFSMGHACDKRFYLECRKIK